MRKQMGGNITIEAAFILPLLLFIFANLLQIFFYYHDKNVIRAMGNEIVTVGEKESEEYEEIIQRKLLLFSYVEVEMKKEEEKVALVCRAKKGRLSLQIESSMVKIEPEKKIRKQKQIQEEIES